MAGAAAAMASMAVANVWRISSQHVYIASASATHVSAMWRFSCVALAMCRWRIPCGHLNGGWLSAAHQQSAGEIMLTSALYLMWQ